MAQRVPEKVIQAIEQVKLPKDQVLYHDVKRGWVSEKQNDALNNLTTTKTADNTSSDSSNYAYPLESLGPFGKFHVNNLYKNHVDLSRYETN